MSSDRERNVDDQGKSLIMPPASIITPDVTEAVRADLATFYPQLTAGMNVGNTPDSGGNIVDSQSSQWGGSLTMDADTDLLNGGGQPADYPGGVVRDFDADLSDQNLCLNGHFSQATTHWVAGTATTISVGVIAGRVHAGVELFPDALAVQKITAIGTSVAVYAVTDNAYTPVVAGNVYTATAYVRTAVTARSCGININWYDANKGLVSTTAGATSNDAVTYGLRVVSGTAPATAAFATLSVFWGSCAINEIHYVDDVCFWNRTAFTNLGWSFNSVYGVVTPYMTWMVGDDGPTEYGFYVHTTEITDWSIKTPTLAYRRGRFYGSTFKLLGTATSATAHYNFVLFTNSAATTEADGGSSTRTTPTNQTTWTLLDSLNQGGNGYPEILDSSGSSVGLGTGLEDGSIPKQVTATYGYPASVSLGVAANIFVRKLTLTRGGQVSGHINPTGPITDLAAGTIHNWANKTISAGSTWEFWADLTLPAIPTTGRQVTVSATLCSQFLTTATVAGAYVITRIGFSFDGGTTYLYNSLNGPANGIFANHWSSISNCSSMTAIATGVIKIRLEVFQLTGGSGGTFYGVSDACNLNWSITPA